ncbi:MAG: hypothetical protein GVY28_01580 [Alphaproteobacteria bacterium]|jgi:hypothetical protein|nr:hypothetical protein [Alphaproteobacteria bacterium]
MNHQAFCGNDLRHVPPGTHMCLIYGADDDRLAAIADFLGGAVEAGGHAAYFATTTPANSLRAAVAERYPEIDPSDGGLEVAPAMAVYRPTGPFVVDAMLDRLTTHYAADRRRGPGPVHYAGEMEWALADPAPPRHDVLAYERRVNEVMRRSPFSAICQYDARLFDADFLYDVIAAHPFMIVQGQILANPAFRPTAPPCGPASPCPAHHAGDRSGHRSGHGSSPTTAAAAGEA